LSGGTDFHLLWRSDEFLQYSEQNRFGDMNIGGGANDGNSKSSLIEDDVIVGTV
jgi:hypothetical protein